MKKFPYILSLLLLFGVAVVPVAGEEKPSLNITIPFFDLSDETERQVVIAEGTEEIYQGHPTTLLLPDGKTMFAVWTLGHGGTCGPLKKSLDGGKTWGELIKTPENWTTMRNCPALFRLVDPQGKARIIVSAQSKGRLAQAVSEDDGETWSDMALCKPEMPCVMPWCSIIPVDGGKRYLAGTNRRRPGDPDRLSNQLIASFSDDGGLTWTEPKIICDNPGWKLCEPCFVRSPDGKRIACMIRENVRNIPGHIIFSDDEGRTWSEPRDLPSSQTGDRHQAVYAPDGRIVMVFRDMAVKSMTRTHFVAWVGTFDDLVQGTEGQYRIKLLHSHATSDCGYPGLEILPDGTFVATTYIKYRPGKARHSVVSTRFHLDEIDRRAARSVTGIPKK